MKCPTCGSDQYKVYEFDPDLMMCDQCHVTHSVAWSIGYWMGFFDGEKIKGDLLIWAKERYKAEVVNRPIENIYREILDTTWQEIIDKLEEKG